MFKYGGIQSASLFHNEELNIFIYRTSFYVIIYRSYKLLKMVQFLAHPIV